MFQDFALLDYLSACENILYSARIVGGTRPDAAMRARTEDLAAACGLAGKLDRRPGALSQGEQQRVALCRALILRPRLILADEATGNLDPENKTAILDLLFARVAEAGATLLAVTHDHDLLPRFDRVIDFARFRDRGCRTMNALVLALTYLRFNWARSLVLVLVAALILAVPIVSRVLLDGARASLTDRAAATPLVLGSRGSQLDLVMNALYFSDDRAAPVTMADADAVWDGGLGLPIPLNTAFETNGARIVGTSLDYFDFRDLDVVQGRQWSAP